MKKICIITATRAEYGILRWLIDEVKNDTELILQLVVTGTHLSPEFGLTYTEIEKDGYKIDERIDIILSSDSKSGIIKSMGLCSIGFADLFNRLNPDIIVVLGDRYELLPICSAALVMRIPIAHISGGDVTEGAIDDQIRNVVTMMATLHFPGTKDSARNIERMRGTPTNIHVVGEPGLDNFKRLKLMNREDLAVSLDLDPNSTWVLLTYHPETKLELNENITVANNILTTLDQLEGNIQVVITGANADFGGHQINEQMLIATKKSSTKFKFIHSLGQLRYLSLMNEVDFLIGNSSSSIIEAPFLGKPVINIGDRQTGRFLCDNVIPSKSDIQNLKHALNEINNKKNNPIACSYYGTGNTSNIILEKIKKYVLAQN